LFLSNIKQSNSIVVKEGLDSKVFILGISDTNVYTLGLNFLIPSNDDKNSLNVFYNNLIASFILKLKLKNILI
jgi:ribosomal protein S2